MENRVMDVWRMSAGRPWQLAATQSSLLEHLKFSGELRFHLIESVLVPEWSEECIAWGKANGYQVHVIRPAKGQGFAVDYALKNAITSPYSLKWEDDFKAEVDIPLDDCWELMEQYPRINQICFNKRETMATKRCTDEYGIPFDWKKVQVDFPLSNRTVPLVLKEKWWFGTAVWRTGFIKPIFKYWEANTHNLFNDAVILPMAGGIVYKKGNDYFTSQPNQGGIAEKVGCYIYGRTGDRRMVEHTGQTDSIWAGKYQAMARGRGKAIMEGAV